MRSEVQGSPFKVNLT